MTSDVAAVEPDRVGGVLLAVDDLTLDVVDRHGCATARPVDGVSLAIDQGELLGLAGRSGSGKTLTALAIAGLLPANVRPTAGRVRLRGHDLLGVDVLGDPDRTLRERLRRDEIGVVFQQPFSSLNYRLSVGDQLAEAIAPRERPWRRLARHRAAVVEALDRVRIADAARRLDDFPHEMSGGMAQRVVIAMALARRPSLLIADEPTTALDASVQHEILGLLDDLRRDMGLAVLLVSHDLPMLAERAGRVARMQGGRVVATGTAAVVADLESARGPLRLGAAGGPAVLRAEEPTAAVRVEQVRRRFRGQQAVAPALDGVDLTVAQGSIVGIVGESGSGKTTLARIIAGLDRPDSGHVERRGTAQFVFQDSAGALNPRWRLVDSVAEPLRLNGIAADQARARALSLLESVDLDAATAHRRPRQLSGGQLQRANIARALALGPELIVADEPVSALDIELRDGILQLLADANAASGVTIVVVTHDLAVVHRLCSHVAVMRAGRIEESGPTAAVLTGPSSAYTRDLISRSPALRALSAPATN